MNSIGLLGVVRENDEELNCKKNAVKMVYEAWKYRNDKCYGNKVNNTNIGGNFIDKIVYRG